MGKLGAGHGFPQPPGKYTSHQTSSSLHSALVSIWEMEDYFIILPASSKGRSYSINCTLVFILFYFFFLLRTSDSRQSKKQPLKTILDSKRQLKILFRMETFLQSDRTCKAAQVWVSLLAEISFSDPIYKPYQLQMFLLRVEEA